MTDEIKPSATPSARIWSAYQLAVFADIASGKGHTFVQAVAGSGKTSTILEGFNHVPAGLKGLMCAFNKEIAKELSARASAQVKTWCDISTLHSYGLKQITRAYGKVTVDNFKTYTILSENLKDKISKELTASLVRCVSLAKGNLAKTKEEIETIIDSFGLEMGEDLVTEEDYLVRRAWFVGVVLKVLAVSSEMTAVIDFDDMIWLPVVNDVRVWTFDRVFIDETQDLNKAQVELALRACKSTGRILAVGDGFQAIYGFRGADEHAIPRLVERLRAKTMNLSVTYRCAKAVVREAQKYVPQIEWASEAPEGQVVNVTMTHMKTFVQPGDCILSRSNAPLIPLCLGFLAEGRRATIQGKDLGKNLAALIKKSKAADIKIFLIYLDRWEAQESARLMGRDRPMEDQLQAVADKAACLRAMCDGAQSLNEVQARIEALFSDDDNGARIVLSTTHKFKGLERESVYLLRDTYLKRDTVEERNLIYVGITRARTNLYLVRDEKKNGGY